MTYATAIQAAVECAAHVSTKLYTCRRKSGEMGKDQSKTYQKCDGEMRECH